MSTPTESKIHKRGFASMDPAKHREIAKKGGIAAHVAGTAHQFTTEEAKIAGKKGGAAIARDRDHMSRIGKLGGRASVARKMLQKSHGSNQPVNQTT